MRKVAVIVAVVVAMGAGLFVAVKLLDGRQRAEDAAPIETHRAEALKQLERMRAVRTLVEAQPPLQADSEALPLAHIDFRRYGKDRVADGAFVDVTQLSEEALAKDYTDASINLESRPFWGRSISFVTTGAGPAGEPPNFAAVIEEELQRFLAVKVLGVSRTVEQVIPEPADDGRFSAGRWRLDLFFYALEDAPKYLGGVRIGARNDPSVKVQFKQQSKQSDMTQFLVSNLRHRVQVALDDELKKRAPGVVIDPPSYYQADIAK